MTGVIIGLIFAILCVMLMEIGAHHLFPLAESTPPAGEAAGVAELTMRMRVEGLLMVVGGWALAAFVGGYIANFIAGRGLAGWIVAGLVVLAVLVTISAIPHPVWMAASGVTLPLIAGWLARRAAHVPL
ncbi:hypothetical protein [Sphingomonas oleivorans]|nr:hypothetical protein [Sphingomonas oleivorans]